MYNKKEQMSRVCGILTNEGGMHVKRQGEIWIITNYEL